MHVHHHGRSSDRARLTANISIDLDQPKPLGTMLGARFSLDDRSIDHGNAILTYRMPFRYRCRCRSATFRARHESIQTASIVGTIYFSVLIDAPLGGWSVFEARLNGTYCLTQMPTAGNQISRRSALDTVPLRCALSRPATMRYIKVRISTIENIAYYFGYFVSATAAARDLRHLAATVRLDPLGWQSSLDSANETDDILAHPVRSDLGVAR